MRGLSLSKATILACCIRIFFKILGKTSIGSVERWKRKLGNTMDYHLLLPKYEYLTEFRTSLTDYEKQVFLKILLHPNKFCVGKAISITKHILSKDEPVNVADVTFRRYANWFRDNHYDIWTLARDGEKALKDTVGPYILHDISKLEVGDVLVADGHKLSFLVQNPFTGKPVTLIGFLDWKSTTLVGYEIMLEENTQSIASALRNAIINLGNIPKIVYQDNGRAFGAKYFVNTDFQETGFEGIYARLGIQTVFAKPCITQGQRLLSGFSKSFRKVLKSFCQRIRVQALRINQHILSGMRIFISNILSRIIIRQSMRLKCLSINGLNLRMLNLARMIKREQ